MAISLEELSEALRNADAAAEAGQEGAANDARRLAQELDRRIQAQQLAAQSARANTRSGFGAMQDIVPGLARGVSGTIGMLGDLRTMGMPEASKRFVPTTPNVRTAVDAGIDKLGGDPNESFFEGGEHTAVGRASEFIGSTLLFGAPGLAKTAVREGSKMLGASLLRQTTGAGLAGISSHYGEEAFGTKGAIAGAFVPAAAGAVIKTGIKGHLRGLGRMAQHRMRINIKRAQYQGARVTAGSTSPKMEQAAALDKSMFSAPGAHAPALRNAKANSEGLTNRLSQIIKQEGGYAEDTAGVYVSSALTRQVHNIKKRAAQLYDEASELIEKGNKNALIPIRRTKDELRKLASEIPKSEYDEIFNAVKDQDDLAARLLAKMDEVTPTEFSTMEFWAANHLRRVIGQQINLRAGLVGDKNIGTLRDIYSVLSKDVQSGALLAGGFKAQQAFKNANSYWAHARRELDGILHPLIKKDMQPELLFRDVVGASLNRPTKLNMVLKGMKPNEREYFAKAFIAKLGNIDDVTGKISPDLWSPGRFIRNWEKIPASQKARLFSDVPSVESLGFALNRYVRVLARQKEAGGVLANPSGTAGLGMSLATLVSALSRVSKIATLGIGTGATVGATIGGGTGALLGIASTMGLANIGSRLMNSPRFVNWLATASIAPYRELPKHIARLNLLAQSEKDPNTVEAIDAFNSALIADLEEIQQQGQQQ